MPRQGIDYTSPINVNLSGPANHASPMYNWDKTDFQPRVGVSWSPNFDDGILSRIFGKRKPVRLRGGFAVNGDYFGQALATFFDVRNTLGFGSSFTTGPNTYRCGVFAISGPGFGLFWSCWNLCCRGEPRSAVHQYRSSDPWSAAGSSCRAIHFFPTATTGG